MTVKIRIGDLLDFVEQSAPVPFSYICNNFKVNPERITVQMKRLREGGLLRRVSPDGERPFWIITDKGTNRLEYYEKTGYFK